MRSTIIPAQITTVEDKIAGNLSFTQLMLLVAPVLVTGLLFVLLPPVIRVTPTKLLLGGGLFVVGGVLAVRIGGELLLHRVVTRISYNRRPKYYVYDKNDDYLRYELPAVAVSAGNTGTQREAVDDYLAELIDTPARVRLETAIADPRSSFQMLVTKGGLHVRIDEIKD